MKITCDVICDLLPMYTEGMISTSGKQLVEEHIEDCQQCRMLLKSLQEDIQSKPSEQIKIEPLKKYRKRALLWKISSGILITVFFAISCISLVVAYVPDYYKIWMKHHMHTIEEIMATDCAAEEKLILPFAYEQGAVQDDGALYHDATYFASDETAQELAERINAWGLKDCVANVIDETSLLVTYNSSRYRLYQTDNQTDYNWVYEGLSCKFDVNGRDTYYQFPIHLCIASDTLLDEFNHCSNDLTSFASYQQFADFYADTGLYRFVAEDNRIVLLGYTDPAMNNSDFEEFPVTITFSEENEITNISIE